MKKITSFLLFFSCSATVFSQHVKEVKIPMTDGVLLHADLYQPAEVASGPVILMRTPYSKEGMQVIAEAFAEEGYFVVVQDVRGKNSSEGTFIPFLREKVDGETTLNWISRQSWNNGKIGVWGSSYLGYSALSLSASSNGHLKSIFHMSGWLDGTDVNTPGGAFHQSLVIPWLVFEGQKSRIDVSKMDMNELLEHTPGIEVIPSMYFHYENGDSIHLSQVSNSNDSFPYSQSRVPIYHLTGWYDFVLPGVIDAHQQFSSQSSGSQYMRIGPWYHNQPYGGDIMVGEYELPEQGRADISQLMKWSLQWFDSTLKGEPTTNSVDYYILFADEWKTSASWPPANINQRNFHLSDSMLMERITEKGDRSFIYDPGNPVPTWGGANFHFFMDEMGMKNQTKIEERYDVLTFTTAVFTTPETFAGAVSVECYVSSEAVSTDFTAKLTLVDENGSSFNIADGILRLEEMDEVQQITIKLNDIAFQVNKGQAIRLQISSSNFPKYNRNPNTGVHPLEAKNFKSVKQTIYYGKKYPSKLILHAIQKD